MHQTFYDVLGVSHRADHSAIRKAYVEQAWKFHPDRNDGPLQAESERRMRELNQAWHTIGDHERRTEYDKKLTLAGHFDGRAGATTGPTMAGSYEPPSQARVEWQPFDTSEPEDIDFDDEPIDGSTDLPRWLTLSPAAVVAFGMAVLAMGAILRNGGVMSVGIVLVVLAAAGFFLVPLAAMSRAERDPSL